MSDSIADTVTDRPTPETTEQPGDFSLLAEANKYPAFKGDDGLTYVTLANGDNVRTGSRHFKDALMLAAEKAGKLPLPATIARVVEVVEARALRDGPEYPVAKRVGMHDGKLYIALCDVDRRYVEVDSEGWRVVPAAPTRFAYLEAALPLPMPVAGGQIESLCEVINISGADLPLVVGWCLGALRPGLPCPMLGLTGGQGTAKSTAARLLASLVDPSRFGLQSMPSNDKDFRALVLSSHVMAFDNLSTISNKDSDRLCRAVTGGSMGGRRLYTDTDACVSHVMLPMIANGIGAPWARRLDLSERTGSVELQEIDPCNRTDEQTLHARWEELRPVMLGCLCDGLSHALRTLPSVQLAELPRMADWARWVTAAEGAFGWAVGTILDAFNRRQHDATLDALAHSPLAQAVMRLIDGGSQEGLRLSPTELLSKLGNDIAVAGMPDFPKSAKSLTEGLVRLRSSLAANGYLVNQARIAKARLWVLTKRGGENAAAA